MGATLFNPHDEDSTIHQYIPELSKEPPSTVDIAVIGAGIIGLSTAYRLQKIGYSVAVLDPQPASEATRAAAGMLAPASETQFRQEPLVQLMKRAAQLYPSFAQHIQEESGIHVGRQETKTLVCAYDHADKNALEDLQQYQQELGLETQKISIRKARSQEPSLSSRLAGVVEIAGDHQINPRWYCQGLIHLLHEQLYPVRAQKILLDADQTHARGIYWEYQNPTTGQQHTGELHATYIIVANGLGTLELQGIPALKELPLRPVYGDVLRLRVPENQRPFITSTIRGIVRSQPVYIVPREDNTVVIGATSREDHMPGINAGGIYQLLRDARELIPAITELELYEIISRARPGTPDDLPLIGTIEHHGKPLKNLILSNGYFRHGILLSPRAAELVEHLITETLTEDDRKDLYACRPQRFTPTQQNPKPTEENPNEHHPHN
ncbi:glycine oxidase ThiO [Rothia sp. P13129]|uniref:glycine oxidase ThiO n=1 Tax=Rothia sp. P13129 TaxID=3402664 RepID=UPI003AC4B8BD